MAAPATDRTVTGGGLNGTIWSNYLVTISSNFTNSPANRDACATAMIESLRHILSAPHLWTWLHVRDSAGAQRAFAVGERPLVKWVRARTALESDGPRNAQPHMHIYMEICHTTNIFLNYTAMKAAIRAGLWGFTDGERAGVNIDIKFVDPAEDEDKNFILHYLLKQGVPLPPAAPTAAQGENMAGFAHAMQTNRGLLPAGHVAATQDVERAGDAANPVQGVYPRNVPGQGAAQDMAEDDYDYLYGGIVNRDN